MTRVLYAILRPGVEPEPQQLHRNPLVAWQQYLGVETTGYVLRRDARAAENRTGVKCRAFHLVPTGICDDTGLG